MGYRLIRTRTNCLHDYLEEIFINLVHRVKALDQAGNFPWRKPRFKIKIGQVNSWHAERIIVFL